eukprot:SAG31_NODE_6316_length_2068_cov_1.763332_2_plen_362_part_00
MLAELIKTEKAYGQSLGKIHEYWAVPLKNDPGLGIDANEWNIIFRDLESIRAVQVALQNALLQQWHNFITAPADKDHDTEVLDQVSVLSVLQKFAPMLKIYKPFVSSFLAIKALLADKKRSGSPFFGFYIQQQKAAGGDLEFFMHQAIHRIPRYGLLLKQLAKLTPSQLPSQAFVFELQTVINEICSQINASAALSDARRKVVTIHDRFQSRSFTATDLDPISEDGHHLLEELVQPWRQFVDIWEDVVDVGAAGDMSAHGGALILLNDMLLLAARHGPDPTTCPLSYLSHINLSDQNFSIKPAALEGERLVDGWAHFLPSERHPNGVAEQSWRLQFRTSEDASSFSDSVLGALSAVTGDRG